ncbi:MAG TPA: hypothetical protein VEC35_24835 [Noviherbaspirillum sp.]|nr:hypothetical protein [Noviherbaspirillum sp.]
MTTNISQPCLTPEGIMFMVTVDYVGRKCIVTHAALHKLSELKSIDAADADMMELFHAFEATINGVARRMVAARVPNDPLVMLPMTFCAPSTP